MILEGIRVSTDMDPDTEASLAFPRDGLADKWDRSYSRCMFWLRCQLCFSLLRSAIMCIRGHRSVAHRPIPSNIYLAYSEGRLTSVALD